MKKNKILNIVLTTMMLLSTILTPQISYAISDGLNGDDAEETSQTDPDENDDTAEEDVEETIKTNDNAGGEGSAEVEETNDGNEEADAEDEKAPVDDDAVEDETPNDTNNNDPPTNEENDEDEVDSEEADAEETVSEEEAAEETEEAEINATSEEILQSTDLGNIFTFESFTLDGESIEDGAIIDVDDGTEVQVEFAWDTENVDATAGDTASMQLPNVFQHVNISNQEITTGGIVVGTYSIANDVLEFVFNDNIENGTVQNGVVGLNLQFNLEQFQENIEQEIAFNDLDETTLTVTARPTSDISGITKEGHPDRDLNAREITWSIDVMNDSDGAISNANLSDALPDGLGEPGDFVVNELSVGLNGNKVLGDSVDVNPDVDGNVFSIDFQDIAPFTGYRVAYTTTIEDYTNDSFTNEALFSYGDTNLPAEATVDGLERSNPIQKDGEYNWDTHQIDWVITVNESGGEIDEAIIYDTPQDELSLEERSIEVLRYDSNLQNEESITIDSDGFPINLGQVSTNEIYKIQFSTDVDWSQINDGNYQKHNIFTNNTELHDGEIPIGEADAEVEHWRIDILEKAGNSNVDYEDKTLTWTVDVNQTNHQLGNVVITDQLPAGVTLEEADIEITNSNGNDYSHNGISITGMPKEGQTVVIKFDDLGTEHITIEYTTSITDFTIDDFSNNVSLSGDGIGEDPIEEDVGVEVPENYFGKSHQMTRYNDKTMAWQLTVNPQREGIDNFQIIDTFPNKGMIMLPASLHITIGGEHITDGVNISPNTDDGETGYHKGFILDFDEDILPINNEMTIAYDTSYDPQYDEVNNGDVPDPHNGEDRLYINQAHFSGKTVSGNNIDEERQAETRVREDSWNSGYKDGQLVREDEEGDPVDGWESGSERKIAWELYTNYQQQDLGTGVVIEDTLDYEGTIDENSITVSEYEVAADGGTTITDEVLSSDNYTLDYNSDSFTLTFDDDFTVNERYVVQFTTTVPNISEPNYTNDATVTVGDNEYPYSKTVNYDKHDEFLAKGADGLLEGDDVFTGEEIDWEITLNESLSVLLQDVIITDTISPGLVYVEDSLEIERLDDSVLEDEAYDLASEVNDKGETVLTIDLNFDLEEILVLSYTTVVTETDGEVGNSVVFEGTGIDEQEVTLERLSASQFSWVDGEFNPNRGAIRVTKEDTEGNTIDSDEATFVLEFELNGERVQFGDEFTTQNGILEIGNLPLRTYYLREVESPDGYILSDEEVEVVVDQAYGGNENVFEVDFENIAEVEVSVTKEWQDAENQDGKRPESITVILLENGTETDQTITLSGSNDVWTGSFTGLSPIDEDGDEIEYTIDEVAVDEYQTDITVNPDDSLDFEITNSYTPELIDITGEKIWDDGNDQDGIRPESITVNLLADGAEIDEEVVTPDTEENWEYAFTDLPKYSEGEAIDYTIEEIEVPGYETEVEGYDIRNVHTPETIEFDVSKEWNDNDNQDGVRPNNVTVNLLDGSTIEESAVLNEGNSWQHTFTDLPKYDDGEEIQYSVTEDAVAGYSTSIKTTVTEEGLESVVSNTYTPEETTATVTKLWNDENNQDGNRPDSIEVQLLANGENHGDPVVLTETSNWTYTWDNLALFANGDEINYTVDEIETSEDYVVSIDNNNRGNLTITNSYEPKTINIPVVKSWDDADNQDDIRPNNVTVNLLADGEVESTTILDEERDWQHTFTDLPVYENGTEINYTITENTVEDYSTSIEADPEVENGYIINNQHTPDETSVTVTKAWDDSDNQDGNRPNDIQVQLLADGETQGEPVTLMEAEGWTYTWSGLDANADGEAIEYTVEEINAADDYTVSVDDRDHGNIIITNSSELELIDIPVQKIWDDADDQDEERPEQITLNLLNDHSEIVKSAVVQAQEGNEWEYTFENLPKFEDGEEIDYSVTENFVSDYSTEVEENDDGVQIVTNSYTPDETSVTVTKGWNDSNNQDGNRPDEIEVQLLADGEELEEPVTLTAGSWTHTWDGLDLNVDGNAIAYSVEEVNVPDRYTSAINDENHGNITITNSYEPELIDIPVQKIWDDADNQDGVRPDRVEVNLLADGEKIREVHITEATDWQHEFTDLPRFKVGQEGQEVEYTLNENNIEGYSLTNIEFNEETETHELTNSYTPEETSVTVTKSWNDAENQDGNRPDDIEVQLLADGETHGESVTLTAGSWTHTWPGLDAYADGEPINYSVEEINVPEEYDVTINDSDHGNIMIRNNYEPELIDIPVQKVWDDAGNQDGIRPERVMVDLLADGEKIREAHITEDSDTEESDWTHTFTGLPRYKEGQQGQEINYTLYESPVENYVNDIDFNETTGEYEVTNSYTPETIEISGTKTWDDADDQDGIRPEKITVNLLDEDDEEVDTIDVEADANGNWNYTFTDVPLNKPGEVGEIASYTIEEAVVDEYKSTVDGYDLTNKHIPYTRDVSVNKVWDDADNQDGIRPENVEVQLLADGEIFEDPITLNEENNWSYTWEDLAVNEAGESITYSAQEVNVPEGYESTAGEIEEDLITITNEHEPATMNIPVTKVWNDADNQDGIRPEEVTVNLLANGTQIDNENLALENDWSHTFENLPVYSAGEEINYTLTENTVEDYSPEIDNEEYTITNNYTPEETVVTVTKNWDDANNQDGNRPENIEVQLIGNDEEVGEPVVLNAENNWTYSWPELALNDAGSAIDYSVVELNTPEEYEVDINAEDHGNIIISNSYTPETINVDGVKTWDDAENQDGIRPETVTINLLADGNPADSLDISAEDNWNYEFTNLPKFEDGEEIVYTVEEEEVAGYEASYEGTDITNTHIPELINIPGAKIWDDADNQDGERPETITVDLLANGTVVDSVEVSEETNWSFEFTDVPKYTEGQEGLEVVYTLQEANVEGYSTEIDGYEITNSYTPGQTSVNVVKSWDDENNLDARPEAITVNLLANGEAIDSAELTAENNWQADFLELDEYANGELIEYTVEEVTPHGFVTEAVEGNARDGFIVTNRPAKVSVGDYVWFDENKDGLQDNTDVPLEGVLLTIEDENGDPVTDVYGNPVNPTRTDKNGWYTFDNLPIDNTYTVRIDREAFEELYPELVPTLEEVGSDNTIDSSIWVATSRHLTEDGDRDPTLDFGFVKEELKTPEDPKEPEEPEDETPGKPGDPDKPEESTDPSDSKEPTDPDDESSLPTTGEAVTYTGLAVLLLIAGIGLVYYERKSTR